MVYPTLKPTTPKQIDEVVSAELPCPDTQPELYRFVESLT